MLRGGAVAAGLAGALLAAACVGAPMRDSSAQCAQERTQTVLFSQAQRLDTLSVRAAGPTCAQARITITLRRTTGALLWSEWAYWSAVDSARFPDEVTEPVSPEDMARTVESWVLVQQTSEAPAWPADIASLADLRIDEAQYATPLSRDAYERVRAANAPMICTPIGPEYGHCLVYDPETRRARVFYERGI